MNTQNKTTALPAPLYRGALGQARVELKVGNMAKPQDFSLYPYTGGDTVYLQSQKRWITLNLRTGEAQINNKNKNYPKSYDLLFGGAIDFVMPENVKLAIQAYLWNNEGKTTKLGLGGVTLLSHDNAELFSQS